MPHYNWNEVPETETEALVNKINALSTYNLFNADRTHLQIADLPFYTNFRLLQATTFSTIPPVTMEYLLTKNGDVIKMDGTREPIFEHNKDHDLEGAKKFAARWVKEIREKGWNCYKNLS